MTTWLPYPDTPHVVGELLHRRMGGSGPWRTRTVYVLLPASYSPGGGRYPVLYFHDGQNLFDPAISYDGEWEVDETMSRLAEEGVEAIVVGVENAGDDRVDEYGPWRHRARGGGGDGYVAFVADCVKPMIDASFMTEVTRAATGVVGSSMGGVISLHAYLTRSETFGMAGVLSPAFLYAPGAAFESVASVDVPPGRIYMDVGTLEFPDDPEVSAAYVADARRMRDLLVAKGMGGGLSYVEEAGAVHHESAWARRLPDALRFLLG